ncbi:hypothetical protein IW262DRAFT_1302104 [Armillaria fumosa]|nr:hypothetical protein IW262DRAFT_1302104 [Armillaria fumosa]
MCNAPPQKTPVSLVENKSRQLRSPTAAKQLLPPMKESGKESDNIMFTSPSVIEVALHCFVLVSCCEKIHKTHLALSSRDLGKQGMNQESSASVTDPTVEQAIVDCIRPLPWSLWPDKGKSNESEIEEALWLDRLLNTGRSLEVHLAFTNLKSNNGIIDGDKYATEKVKATCLDVPDGWKLPCILPDSSKDANGFYAFAKLNDVQMSKRCMGPQTDLKHLTSGEPAIYKFHVSALVKAASDEEASPLLASAALQVLSNVIQWDADLAPKDL